MGIIVRKIINEWDPVDLLSIGAPLDEYEDEIEEIQSYLQKFPTMMDVGKGIFEIFSYYFGEKVFKKTLQDCDYIAQKIFEAQNTFKKNELHISENFYYKEFNNSVVILSYRGYISEITIPANFLDQEVTTIDMYAFSYLQHAKKIILPPTIKTIEHFAFRGCPHLECLIIPPNITFIAKDAFYRCAKIVLFVEKDSYAHYFAQRKNIPFQLLSL